MDDKKQARLVERGLNPYHGGTCEIWDIGNECGVYVDFNPRPFLPSKPETMAFPFDLRDLKVTSWRSLGVWQEDATGGKAIRELGYEPVDSTSRSKLRLQDAREHEQRHIHGGGEQR